jgi:hypothetical protein
MSVSISFSALVVGLAPDRLDFHAFAPSYGLRVDAVVLRVSADEPHVDHTVRVVDPHDQPVLVATL